MTDTSGASCATTSYPQVADHRRRGGRGHPGRRARLRRRVAEPHPVGQRAQAAHQRRRRLRPRGAHLPRRDGRPRPALRARVLRRGGRPRPARAAQRHRRLGRDARPCELETAPTQLTSDEAGPKLDRIRAAAAGHAPAHRGPAGLLDLARARSCAPPWSTSTRWRARWRTSALGHDHRRATARSRSPPCPPCTRTRRMVRQLLDNLIGNAVKYVAPGLAAARSRSPARGR